MERTATVEEKIRRAEEIYARRKQQDTRKVATVNIGSEKKDIKLLKKMMIQILVCILIYFIIYTIQNSQYVFSEDFIANVNGILSYDTNFVELYQNLSNQLQGILSNNITEENNEEKEIQGNENTDNSEEQNEETINNSENSIQDQNAIGGSSEEQEGTETLSQEEQDILNIHSTTTFIKPIDGIISSKFGQRDTATGSVPKNHTGTDIAANLGTKIKSATDGEVVLVSEEGDYGKHIKVQIGEVSIIYAHCNALYVKQGDKVTQGQEIAEVGSTGNSTGPHLHFEIRISERTIDPQKILEL